MKKIYTHSNNKDRVRSRIELKRSNASGTHVKKFNRTQSKKNAIRFSKDNW